MKTLPPRLHKTVCISDNTILAAEISSLYRKRGYYFTVLDSPRMGRSDATNEIIRRNNVCARIKSERIFLVDLEENAILGFSKLIGSPPLEIIKNRADIDNKIITQKIKKRKILKWGPQNLAIGLLKAKQTRMKLKIELENSPKDYFLRGETSNLVIYEDREDIASVITANYAFSIGASLLQIPSIDENIIQEFSESFYNIYATSENESVSSKLKKIRSSMRSLLTEFPLDEFTSITFITDGMPWGFSVPEVPSTHIFSYPDMGNAIANAISSYQDWSEGIRVALMVDPGKEEDSELVGISKIFSGQKTIVKKLYGKNATVYNAENNIRLFPYDILFISTHAGEISGRRLTFKYDDSEGIKREIVVDEAVGFGFEPGSKMINVLEYERFVSLDGILWEDKPEKV